MQGWLPLHVRALRLRAHLDDCCTHVCAVVVCADVPALGFLARVGKGAARAQTEEHSLGSLPIHCRAPLLLTCVPERVGMMPLLRRLLTQLLATGLQELPSQTHQLAQSCGVRCRNGTCTASTQQTSVVQEESSTCGDGTMRRSSCGALGHIRDTLLLEDQRSAKCLTFAQGSTWVHQAAGRHGTAAEQGQGSESTLQ
jgi:hypothetical protein